MWHIILSSPLEEPSDNRCPRDILSSEESQGYEIFKGDSHRRKKDGEREVQQPAADSYICAAGILEIRRKEQD